jgi:hypothetical protein
VPGVNWRCLEDTARQLSDDAGAESNTAALGSDMRGVMATVEKSAIALDYRVAPNV